MSQLAQVISRHGFDASRLHFALRTALACFIAVFVAWLLKLEHPQWAGMTVWIASQPVREHLIEKSIFRLAGTASGVLVGVALLALSGGYIPVLATGLALWVGACAGIGNLQRGFVSYGTMLAGYSAAMVTMLGVDHPEHIVALGEDRLATVLVGVVIALMAGWFFTARSSDDSVIRRVPNLSARTLRHMADRLRGGSVLPDASKHALLAEIAALDEVLNLHSFALRKSRESVRVTRALLSTQVSALLWLEASSENDKNLDVASSLERAAGILENDGAVEEIRSHLDIAAANSSDQSPVRTLIGGLVNALSLPRSEDEALKIPMPHVVLHRDWIGAREAMVRAGGAIFFVGVFWWLTNWHAAPLMLLGTAVMTTLFSTMDEPARTMRAVFIGQLMGVVGALTCHWIVWPFATSEWQLVALMLPFILLGAFIHAHRRTMLSSFDYNLVMLLLLHPAYPLTGSWKESLWGAIALLFAPLFAFAAYRLIYHTNARRRMETLIRMMVSELETMAALQNAVERRQTWRARLYHRLLKLVLWVEKTGEKHISPVDGGLAVLLLGQVIFRAQEILQEHSLSSRTRRRLNVLLKRMEAVGSNPERVLQALNRTTVLLSRMVTKEATLFEEARRQLADNLHFFEKEARKTA